MLRINYAENFKANQPFVIITGSKKGFLEAANFLENKSHANLSDRAITEYYHIDPLNIASLHLTMQECKEIAGHFRNVVASGDAKHAYCDTIALQHIEIIISYREYDSIR